MHKNADSIRHRQAMNKSSVIHDLLGRSLIRSRISHAESENDESFDESPLESTTSAFLGCNLSIRENVDKTPVAELLSLADEPQRNLKAKKLYSFIDQSIMRTSALHPRKKLLAVGNNFHTLRLFDLSNNCLSQIDTVPCVHQGSIYCSDWNHTGTHLATGSNDCRVKIVSLDSASGEYRFSQPAELKRLHKATVR